MRTCAEQHVAIGDRVALAQICTEQGMQDATFTEVRFGVGQDLSPEHLGVVVQSSIVCKALGGELGEVSGKEQGGH